MVNVLTLSGPRFFRYRNTLHLHMLPLKFVSVLRVLLKIFQKIWKTKFLFFRYFPKIPKLKKFQLWIPPPPPGLIGLNETAWYSHRIGKQHNQYFFRTQDSIKILFALNKYSLHRYQTSWVVKLAGKYFEILKHKDPSHCKQLCIFRSLEQKPQLWFAHVFAKVF